MKCGSLFSGIGGLDLAVCRFFHAELAWVSEIESGPVKVLERHFPDIPNLGDVTKIDWSEVEPVDIICGGYPCQPFSVAGLKRGEADERHLWPHFKDALRVLRPEYAILENVSGHLRLGFDRVLADLAEVGFDARWGLVRASDVGAPHRRERLFVLATNTSESGTGLEAHRGSGPSRQPSRAWEPEVLRQGNGSAGSEGLAAGRDDAADAHGGRRQQRDPSERGVSVPQSVDAGATTDTDLTGREAWGRVTLPAQEEHEAVGGFSWGSYEPAIRRWEQVMGRPAPLPVDDRQRLAPEFVEWMMGFPSGHVGELSRTVALKALGNAVVPQQAFAALLKLTMESVLSKVEAS